jgi:hypothetical protein
MPCVWFESTIPDSERAKTVHALDRSAAVTGERKFPSHCLHLFLLIHLTPNISLGIAAVDSLKQEVLRCTWMKVQVSWGCSTSSASLVPFFIVPYGGDEPEKCMGQAQNRTLVYWPCWTLGYSNRIIGSSYCTSEEARSLAFRGFSVPALVAKFSWFSVVISSK